MKTIKEWAKILGEPESGIFTVKKISLEYTKKRAKLLTEDENFIGCHDDEAHTLIALGDGFVIELYP